MRSAGNLFGTTRTCQPVAFGFALRVAERENLRRRHVLVALGKRVPGLLGHVHGLRNKIARTFPAFGRDDDPTTYNWILAQFWHIRLSPLF